jgi:gas vesicle protein
MERNTTDSLLAFLLGAVAGAIAGVLMAPRSGAETREQLADWLKEKREKTRELIEKGKEEISHKSEAVGAAIDAAKRTYREKALQESDD